jgi:hypothetical protein
MIISKTLRKSFVFLVLGAAVLILPGFAFSQEKEKGDGRTEYQSLRYGPDDELIGYGVHEYDESGRKISTGWYEPPKGNVGTTRFEYDETGRLIRESMYDRTGRTLLGYTDYIYSGDEKRETRSYTSKGVLLSSLRYDYDERGRLIRETGYGGEEEIREIVLHEYGDERMIAKSSVYGPEGKNLVSYAEYEYDGEGNRTKMTVYAPDGRVYWYVRHLWGEP